MSSWLRNRDLNCLFVGQLISQIGDAMFHIGMLWLVLELTGSKSAMGTIAMLGYLPVLLLGIPAGIMADRMDRRRLMMAADLVRAAVVAVLLGLCLTSTVQLWMLLAVVIVLASASTPFNPARDAMVPDLVEGDDLLRANSAIQVTGFAAWMVGPALGAALISLVGLHHLFTFDVISFVLSFLALLAIRHRRAPKAASADTSAAGAFGDLWSYLRQHKRVATVLGLTALQNFFIMGPAIVGVPIFVKEVLGKGAGSYALVESSLGLGMVAGALVVNRLRRRFGVGRVLLFGLMFDGLTHGLVYWCNSVEALMALLAFHALGIPLIVVCRTSLLQAWVDEGRRGRIFSLVNMSVVGMTALATGATGWLAEVVSIQLIFGVFGAAAFVCGVVGCFVPSLTSREPSLAASES